MVLSYGQRQNGQTLGAKALVLVRVVLRRSLTAFLGDSGCYFAV